MQFFTVQMFKGQLYHSFITAAKKHSHFAPNNQLLYINILEGYHRDLPGGFLRMNVQSL